MDPLKEYKANKIHYEQLNKVVKELCKPESYKSVYHHTNHDMSMPSIESLVEIVELIRSVLFPGYFGPSDVKPETMQYYIGSTIDIIYIKFCEQLKRGKCFTCTKEDAYTCEDCEEEARDVTQKFIGRLPHMRHKLSTFANAAYEGDPATKLIGETIFSYPSIRALTNHVIAHELFLLDVPLVPRIITELAHSDTGIDIHPGATISEGFFMDHGTGVVIGETAKIGKNVRIYQGVTLGAKSFPLDKDGNPIKGIDRHPIVEDDVIIYSGATILGRITIGRGAVIGGNVWVTDEVPPGTRLVQSKARESFYTNGGGI